MIVPYRTLCPSCRLPSDVPGVWRCTACDWVWMAEQIGTVPKRCPNAKCRKLRNHVVLKGQDGRPDHSPS